MSLAATRNTECGHRWKTHSQWEPLVWLFSLDLLKISERQNKTTSNAPAWISWTTTTINVTLIPVFWLSIWGRSARWGGPVSASDNPAPPVFSEISLLFQYDNYPVCNARSVLKTFSSLIWRENLSGLFRVLTPTSSNTFASVWYAECWTCASLLWLNGSKSLRHGLKPKPTECLEQNGWRNALWSPVRCFDRPPFVDVICCRTLNMSVKY